MPSSRATSPCVEVLQQGNSYDKMVEMMKGVYLDTPDHMGAKDKFLILLGHSGLTTGWLVNQMGFSDPESIIEKITPNVLVVDGFVSQIVKVRIEFVGLANNNLNKPLNVIVKLPETAVITDAYVKVVGESGRGFMREAGDEAFDLGIASKYNREVEFYRHHELKELKLPYVYGFQQWEYKKKSGAIIMEDLTDMKQVPFHESFTVEQVYEVSEQIEILHKYSFPVGDWVKKLSSMDSGVGALTQMRTVVDLFVGANPKLQEMYAKIGHLYDNADFFHRIITKSHQELGIPDMLCHGDLWTSNMLWKPKTNEIGQILASNELANIIDWQSIHTGSVCEDFAHIFAFCCDASTRRQLEIEFLPKYAERLQEIIKEKESDVVITVDQLISAYRRQFISHSLYLPFIAHIVLINKKCDDEGEQKIREKALVDRSLENWKDAYEFLKIEMPEYIV